MQKNNIPVNPSLAGVSKTQKELKEGFESIVHHYLESNPFFRTDNKTSELEIRFGTNPKIAKPITKIDYDNVVKQLYACGFSPENEDGIHMLRIQNEYTDVRTGQRKMSNIRAEIIGMDLIQEYCRTNSIQKIIDMPSTVFNKLKFTQKMSAMTRSGEIIRKLDMPDFNFRVSFQTEQDFHVQTNFARKIIDRWNDSLKIFRSMNRVRFTHPELPIFADITIVKTSKKTNYVVVPKYTIQEADVFNSVAQYEVELEIDNSRIGNGTKYNNLNNLMNALRKSIRIVLSGIQCSKFPISYTERDGILQSYMELLTDKETEQENEEKRRFNKITSSLFIGPSSLTLQLENIIDNKDLDMNIPNIRNNYTVTDKADGDRRLLYISGDGKIYLIDTNMNVIFTGTKTTEKSIFDSLLDGEHIKHDKTGKFINLYAAFDVYYIHEKSVRELPFISNISSNENNLEYRLILLQKLIDRLHPISILDNKQNEEVKPNNTVVSSDFIVKSKEFYYETDNNSIFDGCSRILSKVKDNIYEYNTDGLIFTPSLLPVGGNNINGKPGPKSKITWEHSFKWKPVEFNTIDFLVNVKKNKMNKHEIHHVFKEGKNLQGTQNVVQYKTLILLCGFSERDHGFINPCQNIIDDDFNNSSNNEKQYKPVPFYPTNPYDQNAHLCNIELKENNSNLIMQTEEGDYFDDNMIVEFKYVNENKDGWRWVPIRVRYDKTAELLNGVKKNYGNAYHVANSNWHSIHNPITEYMISTGLNIPELVDEVYYNRNNDESSTISLRHFHNLYVKSKLITAVSNRGDTLIDYAVGKAGDLSKWVFANLKFVYGIDVSPDNIQNQLDGACARYLKARGKYNNMPAALFARGDSSLNIRNGKAYFTDKDRKICNAIFGSGPKDITLLGKGVYKNYGVAESGFNISSCQFAMHYFFEKNVILHQFLRNLAECTKLQGYFISTCYDGNTVFNLLRNKKKEESIAIFKGDRKIYEITKCYDKTGFPDDENSIGYGINVFQESINKEFREYLVNYKYFVQLMEDYGFVLISKEEATQMNLPAPSALFQELFNHMETDINIKPKSKSNYKQAMYMSPEEKQISFMNRYYVFKKVRNVDAQKIGEIIGKQQEIININSAENIQQMNQTNEEQIDITEFENQIKPSEDNVDNNEDNVDNNEEKQVKPLIKKTKKKIVLKDFTPVNDEEQDDENKQQTIKKKPKLRIIK